ncbi:hypothetical protein PybrP1_002374 [[Pythium] brassicae (nom. inval.)]|nr:hypothetical protein PybrP1_002374 [[Pythium] brassicae (nom. inval.)]
MEDSATPTPRPPRARAPRGASLTREQKRLVCLHAAQHPRTTQVQLALWARERFALPAAPSQSAISHALRRRQHLQLMRSDELACKRARAVRFPALDVALADWLLYCGRKVPGDEVKAKAQLFFERLRRHSQSTADGASGGAAPQFSNGWLHSFQSRHGFARTSGAQSAAPYDGDPPLIRTRDDLAKALEGVEMQDVYWMGETRLLYARPPEHLAPSIQPVRMTLALCTNVDGSDLLNPFFVCTEPVATESVETADGVGASTGFRYAHNRRAWLSPTVFREWLLALDWRMHEAHRRVVLVVAASASHRVRTLPLKNIAVTLVAQSVAGGSSSLSAAALLSPSLHATSESLFAPAERQLFAAFKRRYRLLFLTSAVKRSDEWGHPLKYDVTPLQAIQWAIQCWRAMPRALIAQTFASVGVPIESVGPTTDGAQEEDTLDAQILALMARLQLEAPMTIDEFVSPAAEHVHDDVLTDEDFVDSAVNAALSVAVGGSDDVESPLPVVTRRRAKSACLRTTDADAATPGPSREAPDAPADPPEDLVMETDFEFPSSPPPQQPHLPEEPAASSGVTSGDSRQLPTPSRTAGDDDIVALQRVIRLATEMTCAPSTVEGLNRLLREVTRAAQSEPSRESLEHQPRAATPPRSGGVCRFTFTRHSGH